MLNSSAEVFTYRHLIIKTPCLITYLFIKHCLPKHAEVSMTLWARFQHFLWGFSMFDVLLSALAPILFHIPVSLFIQLLSEKRPEVASVTLNLQLVFHKMEINPLGESVSFLFSGNLVITCGAAVQQRVKRHSWILTITLFNYGTCSLIPFHQATEGQKHSRYRQ